MRRLLLAPLVLLSLAPVAPAAPPERPDGRMAFDEVADGLRHYRRATTSLERMRLLTRLAPTHDPRVAVLLWEALAGEDAAVAGAAKQSLMLHYVAPLPPEDDKPGAWVAAVFSWWDANGAELTRRAAQLPR